MIPPIVRKLLYLDAFLVLLIIWWVNPLADRQTVDPTGWNQLIPSAQIDAGVECMKANNNLDAIAYRGRYYIAFRTAPSHFASGKTKLYLLSSGDLTTWEYEHMIHMGTDLREPRFAVFQDTLRLYFFEGGRHPMKFEPERIWVTTFNGSQWSAGRDLALDGYVNWRLRERSDTLYLSAYHGKGLYSTDHAPDLRLFRSLDGYTFEPISEAPQVSVSGAEEGEFLFDHTGDLWGTVRLEGSGSMVVHADANRLYDWDTRLSDYKFDSALLLEHDSTLYLIARRNLDGVSKANSNRLYNLIRYSLTRKKTALYTIDREEMTVTWIMDFPSTGDTAFPAVIPLADGRYFLLNYSSNIRGREKNWIKGQLGKTFIYSTLLKLEDLPKPIPLDAL